MSVDLARDTEVSLLQALDLGVDEAARVFEHHLDDRSWLHAQGFWIEKLSLLAYRDRARTSDAIRRVLLKAVDAVIKQRLDELAPNILPVIFSQWLRPLMGEAVERWLVEWFTKAAGPGDASIAADVIEHVDRMGTVERHLIPICDWLVSNGASELRARRRMPVALRIVGAFAEHGDHDNLKAAVRYVFANDERLERMGGLDSDPRYAALLRALDALCANPTDGPELVAAFSREFSEGEAGRRLGALVARQELPALRRAIVDALRRGLVDHGTAEVVWRNLMAVPPEETLRFATRSSAVPALHAFAAHIWENARPGSPPPAAVDAWGFRLTSELLRLASVNGLLSVADAELLDRVAAVPGREIVTRAIGNAIRAHASSGGIERIEKMLSADNVGSGTLTAAIRLLTSSEERVRRATHTLELQVAERVAAALARPSSRASQEIRLLLQGCRRVTWASFANEDKIAIDGEDLRVDRAALVQVLEVDLDETDAVIAGVLYVIHEAVHLCQRIGDKGRVTELRATGAETTLMHVDLGADHEAVIFVEDAAADEWSLLKLKDVQGRSTAAFPTNARHTTAARARKAQRLVGLRADLIARELGVLESDANEYAFVEFGPAGGSIVLMRSGPPWGLIGAASLSRAHAATLYSAAEPTSRLDAIDSILRGAIQAMRPTRE